MRLIDADVTLEILDGLTEQVTGEGALLVRALVFAALKSKSVIPTVGDERFQLKPRGRWIDDKPGFYECSLCHCVYGFRFEHCPNCGAKMEGDNA